MTIKPYYLSNEHVIALLDMLNDQIDLFDMLANEPSEHEDVREEAKELVVGYKEIREVLREGGE